jgi:hypothetical protein
MTITFKDIVERAGGTEEHEEKVGVRGVRKVEKREDVFVRKRFPYSGFVFQAAASL